MSELEQALRVLRLAGMIPMLRARARQVDERQLSFLEAFSALVQDEFEQRRAGVFERHWLDSGLRDCKSLDDFDWSRHPALPKGEILDLTTLEFISSRETVLLIGPRATGKSHCAKAVAQLAVRRGYSVHCRDGCSLTRDINNARARGALREYLQSMRSMDLLVVDDLFGRQQPGKVGDELAIVLLARHDRQATLITSDVPLSNWQQSFGEVVCTPLIERLRLGCRVVGFPGET
jgi:DNA replication protein DnaC